MTDHGQMEIIATERGEDGLIVVTCVCRVCGRVIRFGVRGEFRVIEQGDFGARHWSRGEGPGLEIKPKRIVWKGAKSMEQSLILCSCGRPEHQIILAYDTGETDPIYQLIYLTIHLAPRNVFARILAAIPYIFGYRSRYGAFEEMVLELPQIKQVKEFIAKYEAHASKGWSR